MGSDQTAMEAQGKRTRKQRPTEDVVTDHLLNLETMERVAAKLRARSPAAARMLAELLNAPPQPQGKG